MAASRRKYRLQDGEPVSKGVARMTRGRIDDAVDELTGQTDSTQEAAVHEARKNVKKLRALVRLTRDELGSDVYRRENQTFRDAGQQLSGVRDADVMLATLADLEERYPDEAPSDQADRDDGQDREHEDHPAPDELLDRQARDDDHRESAAASAAGRSSTTGSRRWRTAFGAATNGDGGTTGPPWRSPAPSTFTNGASG